MKSSQLRQLIKEAVKKVLLTEKIYLPNTMVDEIKQSIKMGYNIVQTGLITPKKRGVMLMNKKYEVRGVYPIEAKEAIEQIVDEMKNPKNESNLNEGNDFIGLGVVKKSMNVLDLDSREKEPIFVRDVVGIYRKEGSSYIVQSALTGNALKVPGNALVVRLKGGPEWNDKLQSRLDRFR